ncbi:MAG: ABC transporter permease [Acidobacteriia bacterium]|nr:ABC transporter permease [Terriglobia bacterium]
MIRDLRLAVRMLLHAKSWTAVIVASLALGIGANTALFGAVNGLLLKKISVKDPDTLVRLRWAGRNQMSNNSSDYGYSSPDAGRNVRSAFSYQMFRTAFAPRAQSFPGTVRATFSYPMYQQFLADNRTMTDVLACAPFGRVNVAVDGHAEIATALIASGNYHEVLGATAALGRTIQRDDDQPAASAIAVVSHQYWRTRFGGDPGIIGRSVRINNVPVTIVGVTAPGFIGIQQAISDPPDVTVPLALDPQLATGQASSAVSQPRLKQPTTWWLQVMGRLKPGVTPQQAQGNLGGVFQQTARAGMDAYLASLSEASRALSMNQNRTVVPQLLADSGSRGVYDVNSTDLRAVTILSIVVVLVLLIVCANVANLLLSRAAARQKELSVRLSLGATRARLIRQLLTESLVLAAIGGALGVLVGYWGQQLLPGAPGQTAGLDWRVLAFVAAVTTATGVVFGIAPALRATGVNVSAGLKENSRSLAGTRSVLSRSLLVAQVAISLVLLIGAGLFLRTLQNLRQVNVGFDPRNLVLFRVSPQLNRYDDTRTAALYGEMMDRLQAVSGVRAVGLSQPAMLSGGVSTTGAFVQGRQYTPGDQNGTENEIYRVMVSSSFFETLNVPVLLGRGFTPRDATGAPPVVVINETAAKKFFPGESPIGRRFGTTPEDSGKLEVVGVLRDIRYNSVRDPAPPTMYVPYLQSRLGGGAVVEVRTAGDPLAAMGAIREAVRQVDPDLPLMDMTTQLEQVERRFLQEKLFAQAYALFGAVALALAAVGLFGLMSYSVARRTNEIGIRMALGAQRIDVLRLVMRESMMLVAAGVAIGLGVAVAASRLVGSLLFGLASTDVVTMAGAMIVMIAVSAFAGYLPARRASRVDPIVALHYE